MSSSWGSDMALPVIRPLPGSGMDDPGYWKQRNHNAVPLEHGQFSLKFSRKTPHSLPFDWYSASATSMLCAIPCYNKTYYNGTRLLKKKKWSYGTGITELQSGMNIRQVNCVLLLSFHITQYCTPEFNSHPIPWFHRLKREPVVLTPYPA